MNITVLLLLLIAAETTYMTSKSFQKKQAKIAAESILLDTSVLIDGRIESIARSGLITSTLIIPQGVVRELQYMADKADHDKRERARQGLDMIEKLQQIDIITVSVIDDSMAKEQGVDERLVELAAQYKARLCTTDYNLNKAARVQGITVLNINEIAHALRIIHLPGEKVQLTIQQSGQERDQGVGYLDDGTMVVVDNGKRHMGELIEVEVTRVLQTVAGKMMFAKLISDKKPEQKPQVTESKAKRFIKKVTAKTQVLAPKEEATTPMTTPKTQPDKNNAKQPQQPQKPRDQKPSTKPAASRKPRRKSMTDRAEDSLVNLLNNQ